MKKAILVTVDFDAWLTAKQKVDNISAYVSECLAGLSGKSNEEVSEQKIKEDIAAINNSINELVIKRTIKEADLKRMSELVEIKKQQEKEREKFRRWVCPVCKHNNFMDMDRCGKCQLPTRKDKKTTEVIVDGEVV